MGAVVMVTYWCRAWIQSRLVGALVVVVEPLHCQVMVGVLSEPV